MASKLPTFLGIYSVCVSLYSFNQRDKASIMEKSRDRCKKECNKFRVAIDQERFQRSLDNSTKESDRIKEVCEKRLLEKRLLEKEEVVKKLTKEKEELKLIIRQYIIQYDPMYIEIKNIQE